MRRNLAQPRDAGVAEGDVGIEAKGDGLSDERPTFLGQQPKEPLLRRKQAVNMRRLSVEVVGNSTLYPES